MSGRALEIAAGIALIVAVVVIVVTPMLLAAPNPLSWPSAAIVAIGVAGAMFGGVNGRRVGLVVSFLGLVLSVLWLWLALDGFGKGTPWWDDVAEAAALAVLFLAAALLLLVAPRRAAAT